MNCYLTTNSLVDATGTDRVTQKKIRAMELDQTGRHSLDNFQF